MKLTKDQSQAKKEIDYWLLSDKPEHVLSGIGGSGKSWLVDLIIAEMHILQRKGKILNITTISTAEVTATTNKAAGILNEGVTIQKRLKLRLHYDLKTGKKRMVKSNNSPWIHDTLLVIDEASMLDSNVLSLVRDLTKNCKILYVLDHCQLLPINEASIPVIKNGNLGLSHLREPVRCTIPDLIDLNLQLRETVETGVFKPIQPSENVQFVEGKTAKDLIKALYHPAIKPDEVKILTYTNIVALKYDKHIRQLLGYSDDWKVGELALINNAVKLPGNPTPTRMGSTYQIKRISKELSYYHNIKYRMFTFEDFTIRVPNDWNQIKRVIKQLSSQGNWREKFDIEENFADLRSAFASTCHGAQGSSYGISFIDLTDLCKCTNPDTFARLLYVAVSRARYKVYFRGKLSVEYGGT